jgi:zinc protease
MKTIRYCAAVLVMVCGCALITQAQKIEFKEFDLANGLHVILHEDHSTPIVAVTVMYHVGSKNEVVGRTGMAHFFEHLLFEGSQNIGRGQYAKYVENAGGALNAETQREVVKEEKRQRVDNQPYGNLFSETLDHAFNVHPYGWAPIGSMEDLNAAKEQDFKDFYKTYYVPNNAVLSLAGDLNIDQAKALIEKYFGGIPRGTMYLPKVKDIEPLNKGEVRDTIWGKDQLPMVVKAYHIPAQGTDDYYAVDLLNQVLSQGQSSRLNKGLVDQQELALFCGAFTYNTEHPGLTLAYGLANMGIDPKQLEEGMNAEIQRMQTELISDQEFQKLRNQMENDFVSRNSSVAGIAESLANYHMYFGEANLINTEIERYQKVTKEDIKKAANTYYQANNGVVLYFLNDPSLSK